MLICILIFVLTLRFYFFTFRIPKKTSFADVGPSKIVTPLAAHKVPEENLQFETFKKGLGGTDYRSNTFHNKFPKKDFKPIELANQWKDAKRRDQTSDHDAPVDGPVLHDSFQEDDWEDSAPLPVPSAELEALDTSNAKAAAAVKTSVFEKSTKNVDELKHSNDSKVAENKSRHPNEKVLKTPEVVVIDCDDQDKSPSFDYADPSTPLELSKMKLNQLIVSVNALLERNPNMECPGIEDTPPPSIETQTVRKCAWWFATIDKDPPNMNEIEMDFPDELKVEIVPYAELNSDLDSESEEEEDCYPRVQKKTPDSSTLEEFCVSLLQVHLFIISRLTHCQWA